MDTDATQQNTPPEPQKQISDDWKAVQTMRKASELAEILSPDNPDSWAQVAADLANTGDIAVGNLYNQMMGAKPDAATQTQKNRRGYPPSQGLTGVSGNKSKEDILDLIEEIKKGKRIGRKKSFYGLQGLIRLRYEMADAAKRQGLEGW